MTSLLLIALGLYAALLVYLALLAGRNLAKVDDFLDASGTLPGWTVIFAGLGIAIASLGLGDHLRLTALFGLQYSHVALGLVLVALAAALVQKRLWIAARLTRARSPVELIGAYYGSIGLRVLLLGLAVLFAIPFAACSLAQFGDVVAGASGGLVTRTTAIWVCGFFLFLAAALGGWRGTIYGIAAQSVLVVVLLLVLGGVTAATLAPAPNLMHPVGVPAGIVGDRIPGVLQYSHGLGKEVALGGPWTTAAILSFAVSLIGIVLSPGYGFLTITSTTRSGFAFGQTWMVAALGGGLLLIAAPLLAGAMTGAGQAAGAPLTGWIDRLGAVDVAMAVLGVVLLAAALQIAVAFFAASGAHVVTLDLVTRYALPELTPDGRRLAARIALAATYAALTLMASAAPLPATILGAAVLSLSAQLLPALLGLCWVPWISRSAVLTGLVIGGLVVVFTEPPGLVLFEGLFLDVPWGRWPLTVHSALWGLAFNVAACLLVSIFTRGGEERVHREILHRSFATEFAADFGGPAARTAKWSLVLVWTFLALGPGAILGNDFFSHPVFVEGDTTLGAASLWVWQIVFWFLGVFLVWWLAYPTRLSVLDDVVSHTITLSPPAHTLGPRRAPAWIALLIERLSQRPAARSLSPGRGPIGKRHGR